MNPVSTFLMYGIGGAAACGLIIMQYDDYVAMGRQVNELISKQIDPKIEEIRRVWRPEEFEAFHPDYKDIFLERYDQWKKRMTTPSMFQQWRDAFRSLRCSNCNCYSSNS